MGRASAAPCRGATHLLRLGAIATAAGLTFAALACGRDRAPAPADTTLVAVPAPPPVPLSRFDAPLDYDLTAVIQMVDRVVPKTFGSLEEAKRIDGRRSYSYAIARGPFTGFVRGSEVHLRATFTYAARGYFKAPLAPRMSAGCGGEESGPRLRVEIAAPVTLTDKWRLSARSRIVSVAPYSDEDRDRCTVSLINYDITDRVVDAASNAVSQRLPEIDRRIAQVRLEDRFSRWWELLNMPIRLTDGVWLLLRPERLRLGGVGGKGTTLTLMAGMDARPTVITSPERPVVAAPPLPALARGTSSDGFQIFLEGKIDYATASRELTARLAGTDISRAGRSVTVRSVAASPSARGRLALEVDFDGDAAGSLRFTGVPTYDPRKKEISVPDLDYDLQTDSRLVNAYVWLRSDDLRDVFRSRAQLAVDPALERGRELLLEGLNRTIGDALTLSATVDSVAVRGVYITREGLLVRALAKGKAEVAVRQKP